jgi:hypothetical protein
MFGLASLLVAGYLGDVQKLSFNSTPTQLTEVISYLHTQFLSNSSFIPLFSTPSDCRTTILYLQISLHSSVQHLINSFAKMVVWTDTLDRKLLLLLANPDTVPDWNKISDLMGEGFTKESCR